jgi:tetratricopeptide (TPR) repeat protein
MTQEQKAHDLFKRARTAQLRGRVREAAALLRLSLQLHPTAETLTLLGWSCSLLGNYGEAIVCCLRAIRLDPGLSNPYCDIGAYLVQLDRPREAAPWLRRACLAHRYAHSYCALYNLGRLYECLGDEPHALLSYRLALRQWPACPTIREAYGRLIRRTN